MTQEAKTSNKKTKFFLADEAGTTVSAIWKAAFPESIMRTTKQSAYRPGRTPLSNT